MSKRIKVLDCTLRDGGYCNQWKFGYKNTCRIIDGLVEADIDIIECGFLTNRVATDKEITKFTSVEEIAEVLPKDKRGKQFVCMINYGEYNIDELPVCDHSSIDGVRVAFHKKDIVPALSLCREIKKRGTVFMFNLWFL